MRRFILGFILGALVGAAGFNMYLYHHRSLRRDARGPSSAVSQAQPGTPADVEGAADHPASEQAASSDLKENLTRTGRFVREKAEKVGAGIAGAFSDARVVTVIKAKYSLDAELSAWDINVDCNKRHVVLRGHVMAPDLAGKAVMLALDTTGVDDVTAQLQVKN